MIILDSVLRDTGRIKASDRGLGKIGPPAKALGRAAFDGDCPRWTDLLAEQTGLTLEVKRRILAVLLDELDKTTAAVRKHTFLIGIKASDFGTRKMA
jgi:hypothetical protein